MGVLLVVVLYGVALVVNIWALLIRPSRPLAQKIGTLLQIVGVYTFALGVISQTKILPSDVVADLSSPDLFKFLAGNSTALAIYSSAMSLALDPAKTSFNAFAFLQLFGTLAMGLFSFVFIVFYALVVAPLSYVANVIVSLPVTAITTAASDIQFQIGSDTISIKDVVTDNAVPIKNYLIAFSSLALRMTIELAASFRKGQHADASAPNRPAWAMRHARFTRVAVTGGQVLLGLFVFVLFVGCVMLPSLIDVPQGESAPVGETAGAEILMALSAWIAIAVILKMRRYRKRLADMRATPAVVTT